MKNSYFRANLENHTTIKFDAYVTTGSSRRSFYVSHPWSLFKRINELRENIVQAHKI
jgi:hypothetical protein